MTDVATTSFDVAGREVLLRDLREDEHAHHRVGVRELSVLDVERVEAKLTPELTDLMRACGYQQLLSVLERI